jgi:gas vesicle protein
VCVLEQTVSQSVGKLKWSRFVLFWELYSRFDIEQPGNGSSKGGLVKNQSDVQDVASVTKNSGSIFAYLAVGLGIGAAVSIFLAPRSGAETRQWFANKCLNGIDTANKKIRQTRLQVKDMMDQGQEKISEAVAAGLEAIGKP